MVRKKYCLYLNRRSDKLLDTHVYSTRYTLVNYVNNGFNMPWIYNVVLL